jgi:hypothetical protein
VSAAFAVDGLITSLKVALRTSPAVALPLLSSQVIVVVEDDAQYAPKLSAGVVGSVNDVLVSLRFVPVGNVNITVLPAAADSPPVEDVVNPAV